MFDEEGLDPILLLSFCLGIVLLGLSILIINSSCEYEIAYHDEKLFMYDDNQEIRIVNCPEMKIIKELSEKRSIMFFCEQNSLVEFEASRSMTKRIFTTFGTMETHIWTTDNPDEIKFKF